jgi:hypothetical protein
MRMLIKMPMPAPIYGHCLWRGSIDKFPDGKKFRPSGCVSAPLAQPSTATFSWPSARHSACEYCGDGSMI